jgi:hypothetical protein
MLADGRPYELLFSDASAQAQAEDAGEVRTELEQRMREFNETMNSQ